MAVLPAKRRRENCLGTQSVRKVDEKKNLSVGLGGNLLIGGVIGFNEVDFGGGLTALVTTTLDSVCIKWNGVI